MTGHRMSALPMAQLCGKSAHLGKRLGAGRSAVMGSAFHALCSGIDAQTWSGRLTDEELAEIRTWKKPEPFTMHGGVYVYGAADIEAEVSIRENGEAVTVGHLDMRWHGKHSNGRPLVIIGDIKRSHFTAHPDSLQLLAYAYASATQLTRNDWSLPPPIIVAGIWSATEGTWRWGKEYDLSDPFVDDRISSQIRAAATAPDEATIGEHCASCYSRLHCPEWYAPMVEGLEGFREGERLTAQQAEAWLLKLKAVEDTAERLRKNIQAQSKAIGGFQRDDGKRYLPVLVDGRKTFDSKAFAADFPELHAQYTKHGAPHERWTWKGAKNNG